MAFLQRLLPLCTLMASVVGATAPAKAAETAPSAVQVYKPIQFAILLEMDFGDVVTNSTGGVIMLDSSANTRDCGTMMCLGTYNMARLELSGSDANVRIHYSPTVQLTGPGEIMTVYPNFPLGQDALVPLTGGSAIFDFGAALHVNARQLPGAYSGTFTVDVNYE
jgi:hypothetical protein